MRQYITLEKPVGETPLRCLERWRAAHPEYANTPLTYAGRLDPMASGTLLILLGEECKRQAEYHDLDKAYDFSVLFGIESDSLDVLGRLSLTPSSPALERIKPLTTSLIGPIELPYPRFSAKTIAGKPLHTWTKAGRLDEIELPVRRSTIHSLAHNGTRTLTRSVVCEQAIGRITALNESTPSESAVRIDFRQDEIMAHWQRLRANEHAPTHFTVADFQCIVSSGTYMRSLASLIAERLDATGLAWSIHRTRIGHYDPQQHDWKMSY